MEYNSVVNTQTHSHLENDPLKSSEKSTEQQGFSFADTLSNYLPDLKQPDVRDAISMHKMEMRAMMKKLLEDFRIQNESKRIELLEKLLNKAMGDEEDAYSKCMEIFKKLMRGEKVSPEEMKYLMQFAPLLFLLYQMLKDDEDIKIEEEKTDDESAEQSSGSKTDKSNSSIAQAVLTYSPDVSAAAS